MAIVPLFRAIGRDVWDMLRSRATLIGLVFLFPLLEAVRFRISFPASGRTTGLPMRRSHLYPASQAVSFPRWVACLAGDRISRTVAYALAGLLSVPFSVWLAFGPATPLTYAGGYVGYSLAAGIAYAAFTALELDVLGSRQHAAGTAYSLLGASGNLPIAYMTWLDGIGYKYSGARGLMTVDALANGIGGALLLLFAVYYARKRLQGASTASAVLH